MQEETNYRFLAGVVVSLQQSLDYCELSCDMTNNERQQLATELVSVTHSLINLLARHPLYHQSHFPLQIHQITKPKPNKTISHLLLELIEIHLNTSGEVLPPVHEIVMLISENLELLETSIEDANQAELLKEKVRIIITPLVQEFIKKLLNQHLPSLSTTRKRVKATQEKYSGPITVPSYLFWERVAPVEEPVLLTQDMDTGVSPTVDSSPLEPLEDTDPFSGFPETRVISGTFNLWIQGQVSKSVRHSSLYGKRENCDAYLCYEGSGWLEKGGSFLPAIPCSLELYPKESSHIVKSMIDSWNGLTHPNILKLEYVTLYDDGMTLVALEKFDTCLFEIMKKVPHMFFDVDNTRAGLMVFSDIGQSTILQLVELLKLFVERGLCLHTMNAKDIVFSDADLRIPKLRDFFLGEDKSHEAISTHYFKLLKSFIVEMMQVSGVPFTSASLEIQGLLGYLDTPSPLCSLNQISDHPAFWIETEQLQFLIDIRNECRFERLHASMFDSYITENYFDWQDRIRSMDPVLTEFLVESIEERQLFKEKKNDRSSPNYDNSANDLSAFFRHAYEHIIDKRRILSAITQAALTKETLTMKLEGYILKIFPGLASTMYGDLALVDRAWRPFQRRKGI